MGFKISWPRDRFWGTEKAALYGAPHLFVERLTCPAYSALGRPGCTGVIAGCGIYLPAANSLDFARFDTYVMHVARSPRTHSFGGHARAFRGTMRFRVRINWPLLLKNYSAQEGRPVTDAELRQYLEDAGFEHVGEDSWSVDRSNLSVLDPTEVLSVEEAE